MHMRSIHSRSVTTHRPSLLGRFLAKYRLLQNHMVLNDLPQNCCDCQGIKAGEKRSIFILTGHRSHCDQEGSAPRVRPPLHFTEAESCVFPRIWVHGVQFLLVGQTCVRARWPSNMGEKRSQLIYRRRRPLKSLLSSSIISHEKMRINEITKVLSSITA